MNIPGKLINLRSFERSDLAQLRTWANDPTIQSMLVGWHFPVGEQDQQRWFDRLSLSSSDQKFAIELPGSGLIGTANLGPMDWINGCAYHGMLLGESHRGMGIALDTVMTILRFAFDELRLHRVEADFVEYNERSRAFYMKKCGFSEEGRRREFFFRRSRRWDKIVAGITASEYRAHVEKTGYWND